MLRDDEPPSIIRNIMKKPLVTVDMDSSVYDAAKIMTEKSIGSIVITDKNVPTGIVTERDILQKVVAKGLEVHGVKVSDIMTEPLVSINAEERIITAIRDMQKHKVRRLLVREKENVVGIVTQRDLFRALAFHVIISFRPLLSE